MFLPVSIMRFLCTAAAVFIWLYTEPVLSDDGSRPITVEAMAVALDPANPEQRRVGGLTYLGGLEIRSNDTSFGGYSGMTISPNGTRLLAISDRGTWLTLTLGYEEGELAGVTDARIAAMLDVDGRPVGGRRGDAEALSRDPLGGLAVGFEHDHRISRYPPSVLGFGAVPVDLAVPEGLSLAPPNKGLEAVAVLATDHYLLLTEDHRNADLDTIGWILTNPTGPAPSTAARISFAVSGLFHPTDATTLPNGDVLVLERRYVAVKGGSMRLRRIPREEIVAGARLSGTTIATIVPPLTVDNMEALAVREGSGGEILIYVMSDDNFNTGIGNFLVPSQRTLLMMFRLEES
ncbi:MAG: esterase-like activity of phytase family protein [Rhodospirillales bacterium]|nr:esterase-like activity of phytase family protein [Rhodospirillales bacterium]